MSAHVVFHNLRVNRPRPLVGREVRQLVDDMGRPEVVAVSEAWQYGGQLADVPGYRYLCRRGETPGQRDAGLLVRRDVGVERFGLTRTRTRWPRTKGPGMHWPRSFPWVDLDERGDHMRVVVVHFPRNLPANRLAVAECWARLALLAARTRRPLLLVGDTNQSMRARGPFTPHALARVIGAQLAGQGIMQAIGRGVRLSRVQLVPAQQRGSDHPPLSLVATERRGRVPGG